MPRYFNERGKNHEEVLENIRRKYGDRARILMQKNIPSAGFFGLFAKETVEYTGYIASGEEGRAIQKKRDDENRAAILTAAGKNPAEMNIAESVKSDVPPPEAMNEVLQEIRAIKGQLTSFSPAPPPKDPPLLVELSEILEDNDFDSSHKEELINMLREQHSIVALEDRNFIHNTVVNYLAEGLAIYEVPPLPSPRIFILVGPTGVGKTTTIAKLAAVNGLAKTKFDVRIITVDSFRIGARAQVESYGEIMGIPVSAVDSEEDLRKQIALASDADLILVDTIGKSPRDRVKIAEMRKLLSACGENAEVHLAVSATTKTSDLREIFQQFEPFEYRSILLTKLDETAKVGNLISLLTQVSCPLSYFTDGQSVPLDIALASPLSLLGRLKGLDYDHKAMENQYHSVDLTANWR